MSAVVEITLKAAGARGLVTEEQTMAHVQGFQQELAGGDKVQVTKLDLSCLMWSRVILDTHLKSFLEQHVVPTIRELKIDDIIASFPTEDGLATIEFFTQVFCAAPNLVSVDLSDNALGIRAIQILEPMFVKRQLKELRLYNCGLSAESAETLLTTLRPHAGALQVLALGRNQIGPEGAEHIGTLLQSCPNLVVFDYNGSRPLAEGSRHICRGLQSTPRLQRLNLNDCDLKNGDEDNHPVHLLATALEGCPDLIELILPAGALQDSGLQLVLDAVALAGAKLQLLDVAGNELEEPGAEVLAQFLENNPQSELRTVILEGNELEFAGLQPLVPFLQKNQLEKLDLSENLLERDSAQLIIDSLPEMSNLTSFKLTENELSVQTAARLRELYPFIELDEDDMLGEDEEEDEEQDEAVDELAAQLGESQLV